MKAKNPTPSVSSASTQDKSSEPGLDQIGQNIEAILAFYAREEQNMSGSQRVLEIASGFAGRPLFLGCVLLVVALWILANVFAHRLGLAEFDPAPFVWLQGLVGLGALVTTTVVLITQNRLAKLEERRAHLELQVNLLTEQKVTKLINLIEELRQDLPMVKSRDDPEAVALQQPTDPKQVLAALDERRNTGEPSIPAEGAKKAGRVED
jgi:Predicted membrane protein